MNSTTNKPPAYKRTPSEYIGLKRSWMQSHFRTQSSIGLQQRPAKRKILNRLKNFLTNNIFGWLYHYIKSRFGPRHPFLTYQGTENGIYKFTGGNNTDEVKISLVADWATGTKESDIIARHIRSQTPQYSIHLGDTYFVGTPFEVRENYFDVVEFPMGNAGTFALNGNHEMYARGIGYFRHLLRRLGIRDSNGNQTGQKASYFCLQNDYWRIIGLDTGYKSVGIPILEFLIKPDCGLPKPLFAWLRDTVLRDMENDKRGIIFLSHHQYWSAFEDQIPRPAQQLARLLPHNKPVLWFWGHEHRFALYGAQQHDGGIPAYGRCIGHGGMPVQLTNEPDEQTQKEFKLAFYDYRQYDIIDNTRIGFNGFAILTFNKQQLTVEYRDINDEVQVAEQWNIDISSGNLTGNVTLLNHGMRPMFPKISIACEKRT
jgi:hypothetical protein